MKKHMLLTLALVMVFSVSGLSARAALVSHWKLDETTGSALDSVGSNNGTVGGGVTQASSGQIGTAYSFAGSGSVVVPDNATLKPSSLTISAWVNTTDGGAFRGVVDKIQASVGGYAMDVNGGTARFLTYNGGFGTVTSLSPVNNGSWHMLTGVYDGTSGTMSFYVDGAFQGSAAAGLSLPHTTESFLIGGGLPSTNVITGKVDDVGLWSEALSLARITEIYNFGLAGQDLETLPTPAPEPATGIMLLGSTLLLWNRRRNSLLANLR